jgi:UDP-N-acetylmuramoyl-L-alanyl-D-glutamate--2,6-diaminopimelate ligase
MSKKPLLELIEKLPASARPSQIIGDTNVMIAALTQDSRQVGAGCLFAAIMGEKHNGEAFIAAAIKAGATAILVDDDYPSTETITIIKCANPRQTLAHLAAIFYAPIPKVKVAITGTDGKTSTSEFVRNLWEARGNPAISIGTLGLKSEHEIANLPHLSDNTSPEVVSFYKALQAAKEAGVNHMVCEASSIGIDQHRLSGLNPNIAIFTSFAQDHLDYHGTTANYFAAKAKLFTELLAEDGFAILCADYAQIMQLKPQLKNCLTYGRAANADVCLREIIPNVGGQTILIDCLGEIIEAELPIYGEFQAYNVLAASLAVANSEGVRLQEIIKLWSRLKPIKGRLELVSKTKDGALVFVDYAHTAGALEKALTTLKPYVEGKLHLVFGCGGDRDASKRPQMGAVARRLADFCIITDDNPRTEDASAIRAAIKEAHPEAFEIADREQAIHAAINNLQGGDILLIAGKGHEDYQIIGITKHPFDDALVARKAIC